METTETQNNNVSKCTVGFGISLIAASVVDAVLVVAKEKIPAFNKLLQHLTGHHWISHVLIVLVVFVGGGLVLRGVLNCPCARLTTAIVIGVAGSALAMVAFYLIAG